jgi:hypothetical protein
MWYPPGMAGYFEQEREIQAAVAAEKARTSPGFWKRLFGGARLPSKADRSDKRAVPAPQTNWYSASDTRRKTRQVVIELPTGGAVGPKFGSLFLAAQYENLLAKSWSAGYFRTDADKGPFLLVRADGHVDKLRECGLRLAFSFYRGRAGGLFGLFVVANSPDLDRVSPSKRAVFECIYGLDIQHTVDLIQDGLSRDSAYLCFADAATNMMIHQIDESGKRRSLTAPACRFDRVYPVPAECQRALAQEFRELLGYHRAVAPTKRDFPACLEEFSADFPPSSDPVLAHTEQISSPSVREANAASSTRTQQVLPFEQFEHAMIFVKGPATNFQPSDAVQRVLEEMTGRSILEVSLKARPMHVVKNSGGVVDDVAKGTRQGLIAATELGLKLRDKELPMRFVNGSLKAVERYFRDPESGVELAIILLYGVRK